MQNQCPLEHFAQLIKYDSVRLKQPQILFTCEQNNAIAVLQTVGSFRQSQANFGVALGIVDTGGGHWLVGHIIRLQHIGVHILVVCDHAILEIYRIRQDVVPISLFNLHNCTHKHKTSIEVAWSGPGSGHLSFSLATVVCPGILSCSNECYFKQNKYKDEPVSR